VTIAQIANTIGCTFRDVLFVILQTKLTPVIYVENQRMYSKHQIDFIYKLLYFDRKCTFEIIESKINKN